MLFLPAKQSPEHANVISLSNFMHRTDSLIIPE